MASKSYRKFMATGLSAAVVASVVAPVAGAAAYEDVKEGSWYEEAVNYVTEAGYMQGTLKGFEPESKMTRAQAAQLFTNIFGIADENLKEDFSDVSDKAWYHDAVAAVLEHGIMNGMGNGKFAPEANLTRGQMAAIVVRAYDLEGHEGSEHSFSDIDGHMFEKEIAILADLGLIDGMGDGTFAPDAHVTRAQMAQFIMNMEAPTFPAVESVKAVDATTLEVVVADTWTQEEVDALIATGDYELTVEGEDASHKVGKVTVKAAEASASDDTTTLVLSEISPELAAGEFELAINGFKVAGSEFKYEAPDTTEVTSLSAIKAKALEVKFNNKIDTTKASIVVKKGTVVVNVDKVEFAEDGKSAVINTTAKLTKGDYTVTVTGVSEEALTGSVTVESEKVADINILSETAPMNPADDVVLGAAGSTVEYDAYETAFVNYEVLNQYGEKISGETINWSVSTGGKYSDDNAGNLVIGNQVAAGTDFVPGTVVYLTGVHPTTGTVVNGSVKIGLESKAAEAKILGVYDTTTSKLVDLPAGFTASNRYALLFEVVDQYGNKIATPNLTEFTYLSNNPLFVAQPSAGSNTTATINDVTYQGVFLPTGSTTANGGTATISLISNNTGKSASYTVTADAVSKVSTLEVSAPSTLVAGGETVELSFSAIDQYGNPVTSFNKLNAATNGGSAYIQLSSNLSFVAKADGSAKLVYTAPANNGTTDVIDTLSTLVTTNGNYKNLQVTVKPKAVATTVIGLDSDVSSSIAIGNDIEVAAEDLIVQDQYGRTMTDSNFETWLDLPNTGVVITSNTAVGAITTTSDNTTPLNQADGLSAIVGSNEKFTIAATSTGTVASENLVFALSNTATPTAAVTASAKTITFKRVSESEYASYEVADLGTMHYDGDTATPVSEAHDVAVKVYGITESGARVLLPATQYTVSLLNAHSTTPEAEVTNNVISDKSGAGALFLDDNSNKVDRTLNVSVIVKDTVTGAAAAEIVKPLVVSAKAPKVTTVSLDSDVVTDGKAYVSKNSSSTITATELASAIKSVKDQYGIAISATPSVLITNVRPVEGSTFAVTANTNNTAAPVITNATAGDKFTATYKYASGVTVVVEYTVAAN